VLFKGTNVMYCTLYQCCDFNSVSRRFIACLKVISTATKQLPL
jgi:hypothetical protein